MTTICCDYDCPTAPAQLIDRIMQCCRLWGWDVWMVRYDRTRHGWHVLVFLTHDVPPPLVVAAQAIWGSDWRREMFNLRRVQHLRRVPAYWRCRWNVLYEEHIRGIKIGVKIPNT